MPLATSPTSMRQTLFRAARALHTACSARFLGVWIKRNWGYLLGIAVCMVALRAYVRTLAPTVLGDDPAEMQVMAWAPGLPHGTSYPLYIWLARIFVALPLGGVCAGGGG